MNCSDAILDCLSSLKAASVITLVALTEQNRQTVYVTIRRLVYSGRVIAAGTATTPHKNGKSTVQLWALKPPVDLAPVAEPSPTKDGIKIAAQAIASRPDLQRVWAADSRSCV